MGFPGARPCPLPGAKLGTPAYFTHNITCSTAKNRPATTQATKALGLNSVLHKAAVQALQACQRPCSCPGLTLGTFCPGDWAGVFSISSRPSAEGKQGTGLHADHCLLLWQQGGRERRGEPQKPAKCYRTHTPPCHLGSPQQGGARHCGNPGSQGATPWPHTGQGQAITGSWGCPLLSVS